MMGPPKESNLKNVPKQLHEEMSADLSMPEVIDNKPQLRLVREEDAETEKVRKEQESKNLEAISRINQKLLSANLAIIRTVDIKALCFTDYVYICQNVRNIETGKTDWEYVKANLSKENQEKFIIRKFRTLSTAIRELGENLKRDRPETFSSKFVERNYPDLFAFLQREYDKKKIDWVYIIKELGQIESKFIREHMNLEKEDAILLLEDILNHQEKPINVTDLFQINSTLYEHLRHHYQKGYEFVDWQEVKQLLPEQIKEKLKLPKDYFERKCISQINEFLLATEQTVVTPRYLWEKISYTMQKASVCFKDKNGDMDWNRISTRLSSEAKNKLNFNRTKASALKELNELLTAREFKKINPTLIRQLNQTLYGYLIRNFKNANGHVDWKFIVMHLRNDIREKFNHTTYHHHLLPEKVYENKSEIDEALRDSKQYLYTFLEAKPGIEFDKRDEICKTLVNLARKGNKTAEQELINYTCFLTEKWAQQIPQFAIWKFYKDKEYELIRRCIYNYKPQSPFVGYVKKSLEKASLGLEHIKELEYEDGRRQRKALNPWDNDF